MFVILPGSIFNFLTLAQILHLDDLTSDFQLYGANILMKWPQDLGQVKLFLTQYSDWLLAFLHFCVLLSGQPEIIALSEILRVNCCVWEVRQGYAEVIFHHLLISQAPGTNTVHLHYASRRHYEFTDISKVKIIQPLPVQTFIEGFIFFLQDFMPPQVLPHDYRRSNRQRRPRAHSP